MRLNIYLNGVGGQGIGVLSELIIRAYHHAGFGVKGVDTHGLAQRGGSVESHIRVGSLSGSPLIEAGRADVVLSLERTEALRAMSLMLRDGGSLAYYNTSWQSLPVRLGSEIEVQSNQIEGTAEQRGIKLVRIDAEGAAEVRTQNISLLSGAVAAGLLPDLHPVHLETALADLFSGELLEMNINKLYKQTK